MIVETLPMFYYEKMVGYMPSSFAYLVFAGERIEVGLRRGKFDCATSTGAGNRRTEMSGAKKREGDAHAVTTAPTWPKSQQTPHNPTYQYSPHQPSYSTNIGTHPNPAPIQQRLPTQPQRPPHKICFLHNLDPPKTPIPTRALTRGGISRKESPQNSPR